MKTNRDTNNLNEPSACMVKVTYQQIENCHVSPGLPSPTDYPHRTLQMENWVDGTTSESPLKTDNSSWDFDTSVEDLLERDHSSTCTGYDFSVLKVRYIVFDGGTV